MLHQSGISLNFWHAPAGGCGWRYKSWRDRRQLLNHWLWLLAVLGYAGCYLNRPVNAIDRKGAIYRYASPAILPWYLLHQTLIVVFASWRPGKALLGALLAGVYVVASFAQVAIGLLIDRYPLKRLYLGVVLLQAPLFMLAAAARLACFAQSLMSRSPAICSLGTMLALTFTNTRKAPHRCGALCCDRLPGALAQAAVR